MDDLERIWEPVFIHDSYACRKGKGIHRGVLRLRQFMRQVTANGTLPAYYLQLDIKNYFMSIDKQILCDLVARRLKSEEALWLTRVLIFHDCTENKVKHQYLACRIPLSQSQALPGHAPQKGGLLSF